MGFGLVNDLLTTSTHYSELKAITAPPLISTIHKSSENPLSFFQHVFTSRSLATASNSGNSYVSRAQVLSSQTPVQNWIGLTFNKLWPCSFLITSRYGPHRKHSSSIVAFVSVAAGTCLRNRCPETALVYTPIWWSLHSNGCIRYNIVSILLVLRH
jgi:hypothetical protein